MKSPLVHWMVCVILMLGISIGLSAQEKVQFGIFGGGSFISRGDFDTPNPPPLNSIRYSFAKGGVFGLRVREALNDRFGLEQSFTLIGTNNIQFTDVAVGNRLRQFYFNGNIYGNDADSRFRPYFSGGVGADFLSPTDSGKQLASVPLGNMIGTDPVMLGSSTLFQFNLGAGLQMKLGHRVAFDLSARSFFHNTPTFQFPGAFNAGRLNQINFQPQGGLMLLLGERTPPIVHTFSVGPSLDAGNTSLCPGESTTLKVSASDSIPENKLTYRWTVKGQEVAGAGPEYIFTAPGEASQYETVVTVFYDTAGLSKRQLKAVKKNPAAPVTRSLVMNVKQYRPPQASASADRTTVLRGERVRLTGQAEGSECSPKLAYRWTVNQGRLVGGDSQINAELDTSGLPFDESLQSRQEQKITATFEATDEKGARASATRDILVSYQPPPPKETPKAVQLADINFAKNSARVNNCAKRLLANELYSQLTDARYRDYDVLLIGHLQGGESKAVRAKKGRKSSSLDRERVLNTAAFLSGKGTTCKDIELTRMKVSWVGTQQDSEFKSTFCDASTREKGRDLVSQKDENAKFRRVEVWLVPKGAELPQGVGNVQDLPTDEVTAKGCPK
jgi:hypothetical protein